MRFFRPILISLALVAIAGCHPPKSGEATATDSTPSNDSELSRAQELVAGASHGQMRVVKVFAGPDGLLGLITEPSAGGAKQIVWASPHLEVVLPSDAIDKAGKPQNNKFMTDQKIYISPTELGQKVKDQGFIIGKGGPLITVFMDPNCIFCHELYKKLLPETKAGKLRVRFVMVGFLKPSSIPRAVGINTASNPAKALDTDEMAFDVAHEEGGGKPPATVAPEDAQKVQATTALMNSAGATGTPAIIACQKGSADPTLLTGMPQDVPGFLGNLDTAPTADVCK